MRIIAISGSPGVGKSTIAKMLAKRLNAHVISISDLVRKHKVQSIMDRKRRTRAVDIKDLQRAVDKEIKKIASFHSDKIKITKSSAKLVTGKITKPFHGLVIIEGHMSHLLKADIVFILRCDPFVLKKRLKKRKWPEKKINENVLAEMLDIIPAELAEKIPSLRSVKIQKVCQIDATDFSREQAVDQIIKYLKNPAEHKEKRFNWLVEYKKRIKEFE